MNVIKKLYAVICVRSATFWRIVKKKSTEEFEWLPYVATLLSTSLWSFYGLLKPGALLVLTVNVAGAALEAIYVILFLIYAPKATKVMPLFLFLSPLYLYLYSLLNT
jgi:solute carrier family 50 (sugar transporter)